MQAAAEEPARETHEGRPIIWRPHPGPQYDALANPARELLFGGAAGGGKRLRLDEPVPTPSGWTTVGALEVGDEVFTELGGTCRVTHLFDVVEDSPAYRLTFDDGTEIEACEEHRWLTFSSAELHSLTRRTEGWRAKRRAKRPSRVSGNKSEKFTASLCARNATTLRPPTKPAPTGTVRTTRQIAETLYVRNGTRANHAVPVAQALELPERALSIDPYLLGAWLGDGSTADGGITSADAETFDAFARGGYPPGKPQGQEGNKAVTRTAKGLKPKLRDIGVLGRKHVPVEYLRASRLQRLALLQGLMDTDGTACDSGAVEFTTTRRELAEGVLELIVSLGWKARCVEGRATLNGRDCGPKWDIKWTPSEYVFRLERKRSRQKLASRRTTRFRYIVKAERVPSSPMRCLSVDNPTRLFLVSRAMVPTHNTAFLFAGATRNVWHKEYAGIIFRKSWDEIEKINDQEARPIYAPLGGKFNTTDAVWWWPGKGGTTGAKIYLAHMQYDKDAYDHMGAAYQYVGWDELTHFTQFQYTYLFSRVRTKHKGMCLEVRATCNPAPGWVRDRWAPWVHPPKNPDGTDGEKVPSGKILWFINVEGEEKYVPKGTPKAISRTFVASRLEDNPSLRDTDYSTNLEALDAVQRARLRDGDWTKVYAAGILFKKGFFKSIPSAPRRAIRCRAWDFASTEEKLDTKASLKPEAKNDPDYTVGLLYGWSPEIGFFIEHVERMCATPAVVRRAVWNMLQQDLRQYGPNYYSVSVPRDPGAAGTTVATSYAEMLAQVRHFIAPTRANKIERAGPASSTAETIGISIVAGPWNAALLDELEAFPKGDHDDQVDALSDAHKYVSVLKGMLVQTPDYSTLPDLS